MKLEIECLLTYRYTPGEIDFDDLETNYMRYLFRGKLVGSNFTSPYQILTKLKESNQTHV
jgi:hypothetical protein